MPVQSGPQPGMSWSVPPPRRTTATFSASMAMPAPPRARRFSKPHWGLRFLLLLFLLGGVTYFLRPSVPWIHARLTGVEAGLRGLAERYGLPSSSPPPTTTAAPAPVAVATPAPVEPAVVAVANEKPAPAASRPEVTPLPPRSGAVGQPAAFGKGPPGLRGPGRKLAREPAGPPPFRRRGPALSFRMRAAAGRLAAARALATAPAPAAAAPAPAPRTLPAASRPAAAAFRAAGEGNGWGDSPAPARPAAARAAPAAPRTAPAAEAPAAGEQPAPRRSAVREAMKSGDELDRLMATAVIQGRGSVPARPAPAADEGRPRRAEAAAAREKEPRPRLGLNEITVVMKGVQSQMNDCFRHHGQQGAAEVRVEVTPDGGVAHTTVRGELANTPTAGCVESKLKAAVFPPSSGMAFNYRLMVR